MSVETEPLLCDLDSVERRIKAQEKKAKIGDKDVDDIDKANNASINAMTHLAAARGCASKGASRRRVVQASVRRPSGRPSERASDELTPDEAADALGVSRQVIDNWQHKIRSLARAASER